jgi:hypothetical protein
VSKSSEFKFGEYGGKSARNKNFATAAKRFGRRRPALKPQKDVFSVRLRPSASGDQILPQKLLRDGGVFTFAGENRPSAAKIR